MTPAARAQAAIEVLDRWLGGTPAEQALTNWARGSRYAGSGDRAAVRDLVFDAIRCRDSFAFRGGALNGRGLVLGGLREAGGDPSEVFTGTRHAPAAPGLAEGEDPGAVPDPLALDVPAPLHAPLRAALGEGFSPVLRALRRRAPVFLRVNLARLGRDAAAARLAAEGIATRPVESVKSALEVTENARKIQSSSSFAEGLVELQDAASQAAVEILPLRPGQRVLDLCAGGGGKTLAMAARAPVQLFAHDADPRRMADLPARAARAGVTVRLLGPGEVAAAGPFDLVLLDVPCTGSGAWRRVPETKWTTTPATVAARAARQAALLDTAPDLVAPGGTLAYMTCALFAQENEAQIAAFLARHPGWQGLEQRRWHPGAPGDGFFASLMARTR